jgi:hypothetical protein
VKPLRRDEIVPLARYGALRDAWRQAVIAHKATRRLSVGESVSLVFEDRETLRFQIQEMLWIERIAEPAKVQQEIDVYSELLPAENELSATLFIEIGDAARIRAELERLVGLHEHLWLVLGEEGGELRVAASFDPAQREANRISAVQYLRFRLSAEAVRRLADLRVPAQLRIDHPHYAREVEIPPPVRASLYQTLARDPPSLLPGEPGGRP